MATDARELGAAGERARRRSRFPDAAGERSIGEAAARLFDLDVSVASSALVGTPEALFVEERACVESAVASRQREFATGRLCARALLRDLGQVDRPLLRDEDRVPIWPAGFQGSISHTRSWCLVAVAPATVATGLGVDIEIDTPLKSELLSAICTPSEIQRLPGGEAGLALATLHFSIKEAVYKACYPRLRDRWDFSDVQVELDVEDECFVASPPASVGQPIRGRVLRRAGFVLSSAVWE